MPDEKLNREINELNLKLLTYEEFMKMKAYLEEEV
jgi:hypothetical protein